MSSTSGWSVSVQASNAQSLRPFITHTGEDAQEVGPVLDDPGRRRGVVGAHVATVLGQAMPDEGFARWTSHDEGAGVNRADWAFELS